MEASDIGTAITEYRWDTYLPAPTAGSVSPTLNAHGTLGLQRAAFTITRTLLRQGALTQCAICAPFIMTSIILRALPRHEGTVGEDRMTPLVAPYTRQRIRLHDNLHQGMCSD